MTDFMPAIFTALGDTRGILRAAVESEPIIATADLPNRIVQRAVKCAGVRGDEDDWEDRTPCGWEGIADVLISDDTEEALWFCPGEHENSIRYEDIA